jgi:hypothetical protein
LDPTGYRHLRDANAAASGKIASTFLGKYRRRIAQLRRTDQNLAIPRGFEPLTHSLEGCAGVIKSPYFASGWNFRVASVLRRAR